MALTSTVTATAWTELTASAGQRIAVTVDPATTQSIVYLLTATSTPSAGKGEPAEGDDALVLTEKHPGTGFLGLGGSDRVYARCAFGTAKVFVSAKVFAAA